MKKNLRVLFIEDNEDDSILAISLLKKEGYEVSHYRVDNAADMKKVILQSEWDIIISDFAMPGFSGEEALQIYNASGLDVPFILVSGSVGEDIAIRMLKSGAHDYIMKDKLNLLAPAVNKELTEYTNRKEKKRFLDELHVARAIVNSSPVVLWQWSLDTALPVLYVSENVRQFGYAPVEFTSGQILFKQIIHPDDDKVIFPIRVKNHAEGKKHYDLEYRIFCKDGSTRWVLDQSTIITDEIGHKNYVQGLLIDITGKKSSDDQLIASEKRFKELMQNMEMIAIILDSDGIIRFCNQYLLDLTGWKYSEIIDQNWFDLFTPQDIDLKVRVYSQLQINKMKTFGENEIVTKTGEWKTISWSNTTLFDTSGDVIGVASIGQDITERNRTKKELQEREKLYKSLVETSPDAICMLDLDGTIIYCNQRKADMFGFKQPEDLIGLNTFSLIDADFQNLIPEMTKQLFETGQIQALEMKFVTKTGERFWGELRSKLIADDVGNPKNAINILSDVTERKKMQEAWQESEVRFRSAFDNAPIGQELIALSGKLMRANKAFCDLTGYTYDELCNVSFRDFTHPDDLEDNENYVKKLVTGEQDYVNFEKRYVRKDGKHIWVSVSASLFRSATGTPQYFIAQVEDITHRKQIAQEMLIAKTKAEESDKLKSALLTNMSHELRTPMNGILGFTELIMQSSVLNEIKIMARMIDISGKRLLQTLDSIMLLAQLQAGTKAMPVKLIPMAMGDIVTEVALSMDELVKEKGLEYILDIKPDVYAEIEPKLLRSAIAILIENALKYTHKGSIRISLNADEIDNKKCALITVQDTGIGIPEHYKDVIFEEFRQVSEGYDRNYEGIGIGLSITQRIIELFNGQISVNSTPDVGSAFTFVLPLYTGVKIEKTETPKIEKNIRITPLAKPTTDIRVLIVEDNMINTKLLVNFLNSYCSMIDCASTGEAAVDMTKTNKYDAILMDINLGSGMDGLQAAQIIRKQPGYESTPIVAVTGYTMIGDKERLIEGGCSHYIGKPFNKDSIINMLNDVLVASN